VGGSHTVTQLVDEGFLGVCCTQPAALVSEGDQAGVEANAALCVILRAEPGETWGSICAAVSQPYHIQVPVGPDMGEAVLTVVHRGEHIEYLGAGGR
jgi:hypothetical protein